MSENEHEITVFYDGACPRCVRDRAQYERWAGQAGEGVCWFDITGQDEQLRALGIDPRRASTELHVLDEHQRLRSELEAYIVLLERVPRLKPLAWLVGRPRIRTWLAQLYILAGQPSSGTEWATVMKGSIRIDPRIGAAPITRARSAYHDPSSPRATSNPLPPGAAPDRPDPEGEIRVRLGSEKDQVY